MKDCNSCGKCCIKYSHGGLSAAKFEIAHWQDHRPDIFAYVHAGNIWMDPATGQQLTLCPFLKPSANHKTYSCDIYDDRPDDCRYYPSTLDEMIADECEMIDVNDLKNPKLARITLHNLMRDSHR